MYDYFGCVFFSPSMFPFFCFFSLFICFFRFRIFSPLFFFFFRVLLVFFVDISCFFSSFFFACLCCLWYPFFFFFSRFCPSLFFGFIFCCRGQLN